ncbi:MAG TPA: hypothetical protein VMY69_08045 [Phycisphaerae bacterium]|nr:hypothetical protein [Phycisphaerae bacterium]
MQTAIPSRDFAVRPGGNLKKTARELDAEIAGRRFTPQENSPTEHEIWLRDCTGAELYRDLDQRGKANRLFLDGRDDEARAILAQLEREQRKE